MLSVSLGVEEGMDVATNDIHDRAKDSGVLLPDIEGLGGGDWSVVTGSLESLLARDDEWCEITARGGSRKDGFVTDDKKFDHTPFLPVDNNDLEIVSLTCRTDVLESRAVGAVHTDGGETSPGDPGDISGDSCLVLALSSIRVWRVSHGPLCA
ncbi:hypothetical protein WAI453_007232 [Rhynchosporium graminicola]